MSKATALLSAFGSNDEAALIAAMAALRGTKTEHLAFCEKGGLTQLAQLLRAKPRTTVLVTALQDPEVFQATKVSKLARLIKNFSDSPSGHSLQDSTAQAVFQALKLMNEYNKANKGKKRPRTDDSGSDQPPAAKAARPVSSSGGFGSFAAAGASGSAGFTAATTAAPTVTKSAAEVPASVSERGILWTDSNKAQRSVRRKQQRRFRWGDGRGDKNTKSAKARDWEAGHGLTQVCMFSDEDAPEAIRQAATGDATTMAAHASGGHSAFAEKRREDSRKDQEAVSHLAHTAKDVKRGNLTIAQAWRPPARLASITGEPLQAMPPPSEEAQYRTELLSQVFKAPAAQQVSSASETLPASPFITKAEVWKGYQQAHTPHMVRFPQAPHAVLMVHLPKAIEAAKTAPPPAASQVPSTAPAATASGGAGVAQPAHSRVRSLVGQIGHHGGLPGMPFPRMMQHPGPALGSHSLLGAPRPQPSSGRQSLLGPAR